MKITCLVKTDFIKALLLPAGIITTMLVTSCSSTGTNKPEDTKEVAEEHNDAKFDQNQEKDAQFLVQAAELNMKEIKLSELAKGSAVMDECKKLAEMMINDHQKALQEVQALAEKKGITLPAGMTDEAQRDYNNLNEKKGAEFDQKYCDMMVDGHKDAIDKFEKVAKDGNDADIRSLASSTLPTLRTHLDHAMVCQEKIKKM